MFIKKINIIVTLLWYIKLFGNNIKFHEHLQKKNFFISFNSCRKLEKHINNLHPILEVIQKVKMK